MKPRNFTPFRSHASVAFAFSVAWLMHFTSPTASAVGGPYFWDNDGATPGFGVATGTWTTPTVGSATEGWSTSLTGDLLPGTVATDTTDTLNFGSSTTALAAGTVTVSGTVNANKIVFAASTSGPFTLSGGTIALGGTSPSITNLRGGQVIGSALTLNANTSIATGVSSTAITLNGAIGGAGNLTFTTNNVDLAGSNTFFFLGSANTYTGTTTITTGRQSNALTVRCTVNNALPTTTVLALTGGRWRR
jgi:fibronectin-binding autotransporter adhesin